MKINPSASLALSAATYREEMLEYLDDDGLIGSKRKPDPHWSGGNQLLETVTALLIARRLGQLTSEDVARFKASVRACEAGGQGIYDKNPPVNGRRRSDEITHDDILAVSCAGKLFGLPFAGEIRNYGSTHRFLGNWVLSNTGQRYWDAIVKPHHKAIYLANAGESIDPASLTALRAAINILPTDASGDRLMWLTTSAIAGVDGECDKGIQKWRDALAASGGLREVFRRYHGEQHIFTRHCNFPY